jgi:tetratricopeptide (TPR) repeat protein
MIAPARAFLIIFMLLGPAAAQNAEELAQTAARAMQQQDYGTAENAYRQLLQLSPNVAEVHSNLGLACYSQKKIPCAEEALTHALKLAPDLFVPNFLLGEIRFQQGRYQEALGLVSIAVKIQPDHKEGRKLYAATLVGLKQYGRAIEEYDRSLAANPDDVDSYYGLGSVYLQIGQGVIQRLATEPGYGALMTAHHYETSEEWRSLALNAYKDAIAKLPSVSEIRVEYAKLEIAQKNWDAARNALNQELRLDPESYTAGFQLARVLLIQGHAEDALQRLDEAVHIRPEFFRPLPDLAPGWTPVQRAAAETACANRHSGFAIDFVRSAIAEANGNSGEAKEWAARAEAARDEISAALQAGPSGGSAEPVGLRLLKQKRYEQGLAILLPLQRRIELRDETKLELARALHSTRRPADMIRLFRGAKAPQIPEINYLLGLSYKEVALEKLVHMVQLAPESARAHQVLGDAYFAEQRFEDAAGDYEAAVKLEPGNPDLHFLLGSTYFKQTQFSLALECFNRALRLDPLNAEAYLMQGDALVQLGETQEALAPLNRSLELNPSLDRAHVLLGKVYGAQGKLDESLKQLEKGAIADKDGSVHYQLFMLYRKLNQPEKAAIALRASQKLRNAATPAVLAGPQNP